MKSYLQDDIQTFLSEIGESGCYVLCLCEIASRYLGKKVDVEKCVRLGIEKKCIYYNPDDKNDNDNMYVSNPENFLYYLTGKKWTVVKGDYPYIRNAKEYVVNRWERRVTGITYGHFDMDDFHPIKNSNTVKYGKIASVRVIRAY